MTGNSRAAEAHSTTVHAAAPAAGESFRTVRVARFAEVLRGVSFTPGR